MQPQAVEVFFEGRMLDNNLWFTWSNGLSLFSFSKMEPSHHGNLDQGPSSPVGSQPVSPRGNIMGMVSPGLFPNQLSSDGTVRYQPEGSSGSSSTVYGGGNVPRGTRPDTLFDSSHVRSQPEGSRHSGLEERAGGRQIQPLSLDTSRAQPEGSGGAQMFNTPTLRSPVELRPLSPASGSSSSVSSVSPSMKLSQSPSRGILPGLCALDPMTSGILAAVELKDTLPKAESSDHICLNRTGSSHRPMSLPKAVSSEYISGGRVAPSKSSMLSKAESEEFISYGRTGHSSKSLDVTSSNINAKESLLGRWNKPKTKAVNEFR